MVNQIKEIINETAKPSIFQVMQWFGLFVIKDLFDKESWGTRTRSGMLRVFPQSTWTYVPWLLAKKGICVMGHLQTWKDPYLDVLKVPFLMQFYAKKKLYMLGNDLTIDMRYALNDRKKGG